MLSFAVSADHGINHPIISTWLSLYSFATPGTRILIDATFILGPKDEVQPDASLIVLPGHGGHSRNEGKYSPGRRSSWPRSPTAAPPTIATARSGPMKPRGSATT